MGFVLYQCDINKDFVNCVFVTLTNSCVKNNNDFVGFVLYKCDMNNDLVNCVFVTLTNLLHKMFVI